MREMPRLVKEQAMLLAQEYVQSENHAIKINHAIKAIIIYKGRKLMGQFQYIFPGDKEIVLVAHSSFYLDPTFLNCLLQLGGDRIELTVEDGIELALRQDVLRLQGNKLSNMTPEQYAIAGLIVDENSVVEICPPKAAIENYKREPIPVKHKDLIRANEESIFRSKCPSCEKGILLVQRDQVTFKISIHDFCIVCGQRFTYTDLEENYSWLKYKEE